MPVPGFAGVNQFAIVKPSGEKRIASAGMVSSYSVLYPHCNDFWGLFSLDTLRGLLE